MFSLTDANQIYHEALFRLVFKNNKGTKIAEFADSIFDGISVVWEKAGQAKDLIHSIAKERELFILLAKKLESLHIIVIDDLERMSDKVNLEEVFGIVEELKQCKNLRIILVANIDEMEEENRKIFDRYNEKVIDRIYQVTEKAEKVAWEKMRIQKAFIEEFLGVYEVKNLRTLEKAQNFFDDVKLYCNNDNEFLKEICLICFSIVVESTDKLYYIDTNDLEEEEKLLAEIQNDLTFRVERYLPGIKSSKNLVEVLLNYYNNEVMLSKELIKSEYEMFMRAGEKPNYYKTDEEILGMLPAIKKEMENTNNVIELNRLIDEYVGWSDIIEENYEQELITYQNRVHELLINEVENGDEQILGYGYDIYHLKSKSVVKIFEEERHKIKKIVVQKHVEYLTKTTTDKKAYDCSCKLKEYLTSSYYREIVKEFVSALYCRNSFPVGQVDALRYRTCYNILYVLYHVNKDRFFECCDEVEKNSDKMSIHRMKIITEQIIR